MQDWNWPERRGRADNGATKAVRLSDPERAFWANKWALFPCGSGQPETLRNIAFRYVLRSRQEELMSYRIAGIDVHKKMVAVVVADVEVEGEYQFERRWLATTPDSLQRLAEWLIQQQVEEVVMESTAQYWKPVWGALEQYWKPICQKREDAGRRSGALHLAQAQSNRAPRGRKKDFPDAERLVQRLVAKELKLSFVPNPEQRLWRAVTRRRNQLSQQRVRLQNQLESLLEEAHLKLSSLVSDLLGSSARRMLKALADGETDPAALASLADKQLRATQEQLCQALRACRDLDPVYRRLVKMTLEQLQLLEQQIRQLDQEMASLLSAHQAAVQRLVEVPGLGVNSTQQIIAEIGAAAEAFDSPKQLCSWVGVCPGDQESAGVSQGHRSPKGNRQMRRILNQCANAAVKAKETILQVVYRRMLPRLGHHQAIGAIAHRLCRLIWIILHRGDRYEERGPAVHERAKRARTMKMIRQLRSLGYRVEPATVAASS
jgi:transposase